MTDQNKALLHWLCAVAISCAIVLAGICLMAACLGIYRSGPQPYSREAVAAAFRPIALPVYLCIGLVIAGFLLDALVPHREKPRSPRQTAMLLEALRTRHAPTAQSLEQQRLRRRLNAIGLALLALGWLIFLTYGLNPASYTDDITGSVTAALMWLLPCMAVPFGYWLWAAKKHLASMEAEIQLLRAAPPAAPAAPAPKPRQLLTPVLLLAALGLLLWGYFTGGTADVLTKAVNICTECVGLG